MTTHAELVEELERVPRVLLDPDEEKVIDDGIHALAAMEAQRSRAPRVCIAGPSGAGKSWLLNAIAGEEVSQVGVLRPTTRDAVRTLVDTGDRTLEFVDLPAWEHDEQAVADELTEATHVIVVVTPTRYADASVSELTRTARRSCPVTVFLNSHDVDPGAGVVDDAAQILGTHVVVVADEASVREAIGALPLAAGTGRLAPILAAAASGAGRFAVTTVTERSTELGRLARVIDELALPVREAPLTVLDTWGSTAEEIVAVVGGLRDTVDHEIGLDADPDLHGRFAGALPPWDADAFASALEDWKLETDAVFVARARMRFRKKGTRRLIASTAWKSAVNPVVPLQPRVGRVLGEHRSEILMMRFDALDELITSEVIGRRSDWRSIVSAVECYTPGALLGAIERFEDAL